MRAKLTFHRARYAMRQLFRHGRQKLQHGLNRLGLGMRGKLILLFVVIKVAPLILLAWLAWQQSWHLGEELRVRTEELAAKANSALAETGGIAVNDAVKALDNSARENIERMTTDAARMVAEFLYARDADVRMLASLPPDAATYRTFVEAKTGRLIRQSPWELTPDKKAWQPAQKPSAATPVASSNKENSRNFSYRPPEDFSHYSRPLFLEATFVGLDGKERLKVVTAERMGTALKDISRRENTYAKAETYFTELKKLKPGEIFVSDVIGSYVPSKIIGIFTPERAQKTGIAFAPEEHAFSGRENPVGKRFQGIVRWATPVTDAQGKITGYVTLALDHDHIMAFTDHLMPTAERYTEISDAHEGNYAFIWDHKGRSIVHPRHHSIVGFDPQTGDPQVPWLEDRIYDNWQQSGQSYVDFISGHPEFVQQSITKKPAPALTRQGMVGLDCRYLNFAPQCTGWFDLTSQGGSGSFNILWSGLWKLTTAAAIPYYTGQYAASPRGFGFVAVGAGLEEFHRPATETGAVIDSLMAKTNAELTDAVDSTQHIITSNLTDTAVSISLSTALMTLLVVLIAIWIASAFTGSITSIIGGISRFRNGERQFRFHSDTKDEMGALCDSFDRMAEALVQSVQGTLVIVDPQERIVYANDEALKLINNTLENVKGQPYALFSFFGKDNPVTCLKEGRDCPVRYYTPAGRYYRGSAEEYKNDTGRLIGYIITTIDVTDMMTEQQKIEQQRTLLSTVLSSSPDIIWYKNAQGQYMAVSPRFLGLTPKSSVEEILGRTSAEVLPQDVVEEGMLLDQEAIATCGQVSTERTLVFSDGHTEVVDSVITPVYDQGGGLVGLLGVARDVSARAAIEHELRETQHNLKRAVDDANRANQSKSAFLARMSHEIRTPMNAVLGMSSIVRRKLESPDMVLTDVSAHVEQIEVSAQHLLGLINEILEISKIEAGKIEIMNEPFDLEKLIHDVVSIIQPRCQEKNLAFSTSTDDLACQTFSSDPLRLRQVLINILGNAIKFTPERGMVHLKVQALQSRPGAVCLRFAIEDSGIGIAPENMDTLFSPFEQGGGEITRQFGGTGLGLSISQSIINLLGGQITVTSRQGEGSVFSFDLWLEQVAAEETEEHRQLNAESLRGRRVLVVDDVDINRLIVIEMLSALGMELDEAEDGRVAVDKFMKASAGYYDIILMDVQMPHMDGYEAAEAIRSLSQQQPFRPDAEFIPIVALTANSFKEDTQRALSHGMNAHLGKPLHYDHLVETLLRFLG